MLAICIIFKYVTWCLRLRTFQKSFVVVPTGAPRRISASKDSEDKLEAEDITDAQPSAEDMTEGNAPQQDEVRDHSAEESATDETLILPPSTLTKARRTPPPSPLTKMKRSPTMKQRITSIPKRIMNKMSFDSEDGPEGKDNTDSNRAEEPGGRNMNLIPLDCPCT